MRSVLTTSQLREAIRQAAVFSAAYLRAGGLCDALDAGMNALLVLNAGSAIGWVELRVF